jgi:hypothetical protein
MEGHCTMSWAICMVQQADDGRLYLETSNGTPMFLDLITPAIHAAAVSTVC